MLEWRQWALYQPSIQVKVAGLVAKVGRIIPRVIDALTELKRLLGRLGPSIGRALDNLTKLLKRSGGRGHGGHTGSPRSTIPTLAEFERYRDSFSRRDPRYGSAEARAFQIEHAGPQEIKIGAEGDEIWADGLSYDPASGGVAVEAKFVEQPGGSSIHEGTAPAFLADGALRKIDAEVRRYVAAISDPSTPLTRLEVVVSTPAAREFLGARIGALIEDLRGPTGISIDWTIRVGS